MEAVVTKPLFVNQKSIRRKIENSIYSKWLQESLYIHKVNKSRYPKLGVRCLQPQPFSVCNLANTPPSYPVLTKQMNRKQNRKLISGQAKSNLIAIRIDDPLSIRRQRSKVTDPPQSWWRALAVSGLIWRILGLTESWRAQSPLNTILQRLLKYTKFILYLTVYYTHFI